MTFLAILLKILHEIKMGWRDGNRGSQTIWLWSKLVLCEPYSSVWKDSHYLSVYIFIPKKNSEQLHFNKNMRANNQTRIISNLWARMQYLPQIDLMYCVKINKNNPIINSSLLFCFCQYWTRKCWKISNMSKCAIDLCKKLYPHGTFMWGSFGVYVF